MQSLNSKALILWFLSMFCVPSIYAQTLPEGELSLIVHITGLKAGEGTGRLGLYATDDRWLKPDGVARGRLFIVQNEKETIEIHGLPPGDYAIAVHQDVNGDGKLNRWLGMLPREPYGFSNNVGKYGPASFKKATIELNTDLEITIVMHGGSHDRNK